MNKKIKLLSFFILTITSAFFLIQQVFADPTTSNCVETNVGNPPANAPGGCNSTTGGTNGTASDKIQAFDSSARTSYNNDSPQYNSWSYSSCSGCALASIFAAYGVTTTKANGSQEPMNCGTVLEAENAIKPKIWDSQNGVTDWSRMNEVTALFGFTGIVGNPGQATKTIDQLIDIANNGAPVVVGSNAHIMDIKGGKDKNAQGQYQTIFAIDSNVSPWTTMTRSQFLNNFAWNGSYILISKQ